MFSIVQEMIQKSLDSFIKHDSEIAQKVLLMDDEVDDLKSKVQSDMISEMKKSSDFVDRGLSLILIARNLERFGDHATNIAEDVIYTEAGQDVRHGGLMNSLKVHVVEDEFEIRELMALHLARQGYQVTEVKFSSEEALEKMKSNKFDLLILDWMLPGMSGVEFLDQLKTLKLNPRVLMVTAKSEPQGHCFPALKKVLTII